MKAQRSEFSKLSKANQHRKIQEDIAAFKLNGGHIQVLKKGKAGGLCPINGSDIEMKFGCYREIG